MEKFNGRDNERTEREVSASIQGFSVNTVNTNGGGLTSEIRATVTFRADMDVRSCMATLDDVIRQLGADTDHPGLTVRIGPRRRQRDKVRMDMLTRVSEEDYR